MAQKRRSLSLAWLISLTCLFLDLGACASFGAERTAAGDKAGALSGEAARAWLDRWFAAQASLRTWSAEVIQIRSLPTLAQPLMATGRVWVAVPDQFRWEVGQPAQTVALRQREQLWILYPKLKRAEKYPISEQQPGPWRDALALLESVFPRNREELESRFQVQSVLQTNATLLVVLEPRSASARKMMPEIRVGFTTNDFTLLSNEVKFMDGSLLRNEYRNPSINSALPEGCFDFALPKDYTLVDPFRRQR